MSDPLHDDPAVVLKELGRQMRIIDLHLVGLMARRMLIAQQVGYAKRRQATEEKPLGADIYRLDIEAARLEEVRQEALRLGVDPTFAVAILYLLIGESCKRQMIQREQGAFEYGDVDYEQLKRNLEALTDKVAIGYDASYTTAHPATRAYLDFEDLVLAEQIEEAPHRRRALDLGCCTGRTSIALARAFEHVTAVDLSGNMIKQAMANADAAGVQNINWTHADFEREYAWRTIEVGSVDFIAMTMGTASDVKEIRSVLQNIQRVLAPGGRFLLSFYNAEALHVQGGFFPWPSSLAAVVDQSRHCLDVWADGKTYSVYARPYTQDEVDGLLGRLQVATVYTHPTFAALLPREVMIEETTRAAFVELDIAQARSGSGDGAYIIATGRKG